MKAGHPGHGVNCDSDGWPAGAQGECRCRTRRDRPKPRALHDHGGDRRRWHGCGLSRHGPNPRTRRRLARPQEARLFGGEEGAASFATFSPDGRFIAFQSDATGREEVYVRPVAGNARPVPVSGAGGQLPRWARNGELFFWQRDLLSAVQIRTSPTLQIGPSHPLYRTLRERPTYYDGDYDVSADGQSIYLTRTPDLLRPRELRVVTDWGSEVEAIVARGGGN